MSKHCLSECALDCPNRHRAVSGIKRQDVGLKTENGSLPALDRRIIKKRENSGQFCTRIGGPFDFNRINFAVLL